MASEPLRCAECDCERGGSHCNWIRAERGGSLYTREGFDFLGDVTEDPRPDPLPFNWKAFFLDPWVMGANVVTTVAFFVWLYS